MEYQKGFSQVVLLCIIAVVILAGASGFLILQEKEIPASEKMAQQEVSPEKTEEETKLPETRVVKDAASPIESIPPPTQSIRPPQPKTSPESKPNSMPSVSLSPSPKPQEARPVLKNLGIKIEPWDKATNKAGDFLFENKNYVDNKIFTEFAHKIVNDMGEKLLPEIGFNVPVGTKVVSPIDGVVIDVGFYEPSQDYLVSIKTDESSSWIVGFEHVYHMRTNAGDRVLVGQELAEVSPSYGKTEFGNVEINVWTGGQSIVKYCPFEFLDESLKPLYKEKLDRLARDWEEFIGKDVYKQKDWVAPGCLLDKIQEK